MATTAQEVIFSNQLTHHRRVNYRTGYARRIWLQNWAWFPKKQQCLYSNADRVLKEMSEKYGPKEYAELVAIKHFNKKFEEKEAEPGVDASYVGKKLRKVETTSAMYGLFPQYAYDTCFGLKGHKFHW